jgi:hypothetical protein
MTAVRGEMTVGRAVPAHHIGMTANTHARRVRPRDYGAARVASGPRWNGFDRVIAVG